MKAYFFTPFLLVLGFQATAFVPASRLSRGKMRSRESRGLTSRLFLSPQDGIDLTTVTRRSALEQAAAAIQGSYWSQFADDTYTGKRGVMQEKAVKKESTDAESSSAEQQGPPRPFAPVEALLPAIRVRTLLVSLHELSLEDMAKVLKLDDLSSPSIRRAFNTYTANLRFGEAYTLNVSGKARKDLIRSNKLPDIKSVITADLDLRDLQRNSVLTLVQDLRAEVQYQLTCSEPNRADVDQVWNQLMEPLDTWFSFIDEKDITEATQLYEQRQQKD